MWHTIYQKRFDHLIHLQESIIRTYRVFHNYLFVQCVPKMCQRNQHDFSQVSKHCLTTHRTHISSCTPWCCGDAVENERYSCSSPSREHVDTTRRCNAQRAHHEKRCRLVCPNYQRRLAFMCVCVCLVVFKNSLSTKQIAWDYSAAFSFAVCHFRMYSKSLSNRIAGVTV